MTANCERCKEAPRVAKERYCKKCRKLVLRELADVGYLQPTWEPTVFEYERLQNWAKQMAEYRAEVDA